MISPFEFATATRIIFAPGAVREAGQVAKALGSRVLLVTGKNPGRAGPLMESLRAIGLDCTAFPVAKEPTTDLIVQGVREAKTAQADVVIALGGGSVIDAGKAIAVLLTNPGELLDYLEVIGEGKPLANASAPFIAIPTTAGTGSEVTRNAVLASTEHRVKVSLRSPGMLPRVAIVDPELTYDLPAALTAATGLDALTQLLEAYVSIRANPITDAICVEGLGRAARSLRKAFAGKDEEARADMALAGLFSGMALANAGLGAVHGFAAPIGGMFDAPHGAVCAALLPHVIEWNLRALRARGSSQLLNRFETVARVMTGNPAATAESGVAFIRELCGEFGIPKLGAYGVTAQHVPILCEKAASANSMKGNPIALTRGELGAILQAAV